MADDVRARVVAVPVSHRRTLGVQRRLLEGALHVHHGLERLVLDDDPCRGSPRLLRLLGGDERDRLAVEAHALGGEHGLVGELEPVGLAAGNVGLRQNGVHSRHGHGGRHVERDDAGVRVRAADRATPEHAGRVEVARVHELAGDLRDRVGAADGRNGSPSLERPRGSAHAGAAARTASRIFA